MNTKITFLLFCFILSLKGYSQTLRAKVIDENDKPLSGATVYFDGTTIDVITGLDVYFSHDKPEYLNQPHLVITFLGYQSIYKKTFQV